MKKKINYYVLYMLRKGNRGEYKSIVKIYKTLSGAKSSVYLADHKDNDFCIVIKNSLDDEGTVKYFYNHKNKKWEKVEKC